MTSQHNAGGLTPSRRTLVKGAAWSVPVVAMAGAAPAMAATGTLSFQVLSGCKNPGNSCKTLPFGYQFQASVSNTYSASCTVTITNATIVSSTGTLPAGWAFNVPFEVGPNGTTQTIITSSTNSANVVFSATVVFTYDIDCVNDDLDETGKVTEPITFAYDGTPPDCLCPGGLTPERLESDSAPEGKVAAETTPQHETTLDRSSQQVEPSADGAALVEGASDTTGESSAPDEVETSAP